MKYDTIIKCDLSDFKSGKVEYKNCYLLTYKGCDTCMEIDLIGNLFFNTDYKAINRQEVEKVNNIEDLFNFMNNHNLIGKYECETFGDFLNMRKWHTYFVDKTKINVGGEQDYVLDYNLKVLGWKEDLKEVL